jgi:hypothetical protein
MSTYFSGLDLDDSCGRVERGLGKLEFCEAGSPVADGNWVEAHDIKFVSGIQQRLIQLKESTEVRIHQGRP